MEIADQIRIDRLEKRISAVLVSVVTVQAQLWGIAKHQGQMSSHQIEAAEDALVAWKRLLSIEEEAALDPVFAALAKLLGDQR